MLLKVWNPVTAATVSVIAATVMYFSVQSLSKRPKCASGMTIDGPIDALGSNCQCKVVSEGAAPRYARQSRVLIHNRLV